MSSQKYFNYKFSKKKDENNFFINQTNQFVYDTLINHHLDENFFLFAPRKSGKTHLINIWKQKNNAVMYKNNFSQIIKLYKNIVIDDILESTNEEELFHIINHSKLYNLKIFATSSINLNSYSFKLRDLYSRLKAFYYLEIKFPNDEMCKMLMTKLFSEKQIIIKNKEIFDYIFNRVDRTYLAIFNLVEKIDKLSLQKKKQLTIPLIREII